MKRTLFFMAISTLINPIDLYFDNNITASSSKKIVIIGAGLSGLTTGYRLHEKGFDVHLYEARNRVGGRIFSALINDTVIELGGENITDGGNAENIQKLLQELNLTISQSAQSFQYLFHHNNLLLPMEELVEKRNFNIATLEEILQTIAQTSLSMREVLDQLFPSDDALKACFSRRLAMYEGASVNQLSSSYIKTLYYMIKRGICAAHQGHVGSFAHIDGGNSKLPEALAKRLEHRVHLNMPLIAVTKNEQDQYLLTFKDGSITTADILVLTMPCPVYNDILFDHTVIPMDRLNAIRSIRNGQNAKIIIPISAQFPTICFLNNHLGIYSLTKKTATLYFTEQASQFEEVTIAQTYAQACPLLACAFAKDSLPEHIPVMARDESFANYIGAVGHSWPHDPFAKGSYSYIAAGQEPLLTTLGNYDGFLLKSLFAPIDQQLFFAGEHTSTLLDVPGTMEAACQSGNLAADMIEKTVIQS